MMDKLEEKARTQDEIKEQCKICDFYDSDTECSVLCQQNKWVRLEDALIYLGETETQFAEEVMKYKLGLERERGLLKQKLAKSLFLWLHEKDETVWIPDEEDFEQKIEELLRQ
jgi:hypothetical protein